MMPGLRYALLAAALLLSACAGHDPYRDDECHRASDCALPNLELIYAYFAAYNSGDLDTVAQLLHRDATWLSVEGDGVSVEYHGRERLLEVMHDYLDDNNTTSTIASADAVGPWVYVHEVVSWEGRRGIHRQAALSVYQIEDGAIRRVWYYPEVALPLER